MYGIKSSAKDLMLTGINIGLDIMLVFMNLILGIIQIVTGKDWFLYAVLVVLWGVILTLNIFTAKTQFKTLDIKLELARVN